MSIETRRFINLRPLIPSRGLNARGEEMRWEYIDGDYVYNSLNMDHGYNREYHGGDLAFGLKVKPATQDSIKNLERVRIEGVQEFSVLDSILVCSICFGELSIGSEAIRMPKPCSHVYHQDCIIKWLNISNTCPLCRRSI